MRSLTCVVLFTLFLLAAVSTAQQTSTTAVPNLISYSGTLALSSGVGEPAKTVGVTFAIYRQQDGGAPIWLETQNVTLDSTGHYTVLLGSTKPEGIPADLFSTQEQRWLGVRMQGEAEQPRVLLVSVPYAIKAGDAETVGGLPASAFVQASPNSTSASATTASAAQGIVTGTTPQLLAPGPRPIITGSGKVNQVAKFDASADITNSIIFDNGTNVGIGTTSPAAKLGVNGSVSAAGFNIGSDRFAYGSFAKSSAFLGFAGNTTMTGNGDTAVGYQALSANTTGSWNAAVGAGALFVNTTGSLNTANGAGALATNATGYANTATGYSALAANTAGSNNTASGVDTLQSNTKGEGNSAYGGLALFNNIAGNQNTALGFNAGPDRNSPNLTNATAIGANAVVSESNALVLGGTGSFAVNVGIGTTTPQYTLDVNGNARITGNLIKGSGSFKIDHPLDPANKYLSHSFVESPDMMNIYNGNVVTNKRGLATIELPGWFEALNRDFRYQLTVIGQFAQAIVVKEVNNHHFTIKTSKPGVKVSWQVTGIRQDAFANAHRIQVEETKSPEEQGHYLHPELFGAGPEKSVSVRSPEHSPGKPAQTAVNLASESHLPPQPRRIKR